MLIFSVFYRLQKTLSSIGKRMSDEKNILFYEQAWRHRQEQLKAYIAEGETDPMRVLGRYYSSERLNPVVFKDDGTPMQAPKKLHNPFNFDKLPTGAPAFRTIGLRNEHIIVPFYSSFVQFLLDFISDKSFDAIIELGSGFGQNLIELFYMGGPRDIPYYAGEVTESGCDTARMLAGLNDELMLTAFQFDYTAPDLSAVKEHGNFLVFTAHSIEQVAEIPDNLFSIIAAHGKTVTGIHFEPFGFQIEDDEPNKVSELHKHAAAKMGWNKNFVDMIQSANDTDEIELVYMAKNMMGGDDMANPTSLAIWQSSNA